MVILCQDAQYYYAISSHKMCKLSDIDQSALEPVPIPNSDIQPIFPTTGLTRAPEPLPQDCYIKRPRLTNYDNGDKFIASIMLHEAEICERLKNSPHPNIARFLGCVVEDGRMTGLCFVRYGETLSEMVERGRSFDKGSCLEDIRAGIQHLHGLGIIHCDISPYNIFSGGDGFVVGDFDSCTQEGDKMGLKGGCINWAEECFDAARPENDWNALDKIKAFLFPDKST
ncbi:MAG: hypothetical protein Q9214_001552 [Letrouitia sp. 1 TL-2023]